MFEIRFYLAVIILMLGLTLPADELNNKQSVTAIIEMKNPLDLTRVDKKFDSPQDKQQYFASLLESHTKQSIEKYFPYLKTEKGVDEVTPLWLIHSIRVRASADVIKKMTAQDFVGVEKFEIETQKEVSELLDDVGNATSRYKLDAPAEIAWGVEKLGAPELWKMGYRGKGILTAVIDSGVNTQHPDLAPNLWKNPGETGLDSNGHDKSTNYIDDDNNGYVDDVNGFNFEQHTPDVADDHGHGSQAAGIVGGMGTGGKQTGVAPDTTLMILKACCRLGGTTGESTIWEAMQYAAKNGARVISMSLSIKNGSTPAHSKWRKASESILAMGVIHINSAGNRGGNNIPNNVGAPPSNPPAWFHPKQTPRGDSKTSSMISIGATDEEDGIRDYSSRGPVTWERIEEYKDFPYVEGKKPGLIRPDVCGPSEVPSTELNGSGYTTSFGGTSSATPHIGGVAAVLLSAYPKTTVEQMTEALQMSALAVKSEFNNDCGAGRVDMVAAFKYLKEKFNR